MSPDTEGENRLWPLLECLPLAVAVFDREGRTQYVNAKFVDLFGYGAQEIATLDAWWQKASPDHGSYVALRDRWQRILSRTEQSRFEVEPIAGMATCKGGEPRYLEMRANILGERILATVIDLTARRQAEQSMLQAKGEVDRVLREKSEFVARIGRDIYGPLNVILGYAQLLEQDAGLPEAERAQIREIKMAGDQMLEMIKQVIGVVRPAPAADAAEPAPASRRRILAAEDYEPNRILLKRQLSKLGYEVDFAQDGAEALRMWQAADYGVILTDCNMPVMDGITLAERIREIERGQGGHVPIVALSANTIQQDIDRCLSSGIDAFLGKPVQLHDLKAVLDRFSLGGERVAGPAPAAGLVEAADSAMPQRSPLQVLRTLLDENDQGELTRMSEIFIGSVQGLLAEIDAGMQATNAEAIGKSLHKLKSSLLAVGDEVLAGQAVALESAAKAGDWMAIRSGLPQLSRAAADVVQVIREESQRLSLAQAPRPGRALPAGADWSALQVLVVDDDAFMRLQIGSILQRLGVREVRQAGNGTEALASLDAHPHGTDVIVTDLNMPGMDGVEFIRHLVARKFRGDIAFVSGEDSRVLSSVQELARAQNLRVLGTLVKPVYSAALYEVLNRYGVSETAASGTAAGPAISVGELLTGLESNQFMAYFQPKVDANSLGVIGVEVLARWNHPQHGILSPGLFVPLAEDGGLIEILTMAIFKSAIDAGSELHRQGHKLKIAVNYSAQSFGSLELPEFIVATSQAAGLDPRYLIIEVTESGLVRDPTVALDVLSRLRLKGISLSIDDFGTGYSSMEQLRRIPFSELKIDQGFVRGAGQDATARSILESSIAMAKKLNLTTVAEGVETQEDLDVVRGLGCDLVQGYLIAKPMALADLIAWLQRKR
jgi:PAS domain S-box-containing protein